MNNQTIHRFHIPVMGLAYTIDSPLKVARYGIDSVISIIEDRLIEMMRSYYYQQYNQVYQPIGEKEPDCRARRITDYLNLVNRIVKNQFVELKNSAFEKGSEIVKYFDLLPNDSSLKQLYNKMLNTNDESEKLNLQEDLRKLIKSGSIDVNIMTKVDKDNYDHKGNIVENGSDALTALRAYAESELQDSSIVFSAGMNPRLFNYLEKFDSFLPNATGQFNKKIILKVSDFRSALIQGKYLAKKGLWVSEFRIESGLNCGGHAFATDGFLLGPILEEFKTRRTELNQSLLELYTKAFEVKGMSLPETMPSTKITVQGGIGTSEEQSFLFQYYQIDGTGWGSPFLLVPEATTVDQRTLNLLAQAREDDVVLSQNSPLGVHFNYLKGTTSEQEKLQRIANNKPGSPCTEKYLQNNVEFTEKPICTASVQYQKLKIAELRSQELAPDELNKKMESVLDKECLCIGLSNAAAINCKTKFLKNLTAVTICPGPNIAYFNKTASLREMVDHIYGRINLLGNVSRPDLFTKELQLYIDYLAKNMDELRSDLKGKKVKYFTEFGNNLKEGINYYRKLSDQFAEFNLQLRTEFSAGLDEAEKRLDSLFSKHLLIHCD